MTLLQMNVSSSSATTKEYNSDNNDYNHNDEQHDLKRTRRAVTLDTAAVVDRHVMPDLDLSQIFGSPIQVC